MKAYGDSAYCVVDLEHVRARHNYEDNTPREILENKVLSSCRECIEWDYGDVGRYWKLMDYKKVLKLQNMPIAEMYLVALILRNAMCTLSPNITAITFVCAPPSLETWLSQGPNARANIMPNPDEVL